MNDELATCPFCGKDDIEISYGNREYWGYCKYCGASSAMYSNKHMAVVQWNTRPEKEEYKENSFCWDIRCRWLEWVDMDPATCGNKTTCEGTYKDFLQWLGSHNYKMVKTKEG